MRSKSRKATATFLLICGLFSVFYIDYLPGWNNASRVALPLSLVLEKHWHIDTYADFTGDKATIGTHYYTDKAPLPSLLLVPPIYLYNQLFDLASQSTNKQMRVALILAALLLGVVPFLLTISLSIKILSHNHVPIWLIYLFFFGSFTFAYASTGFSHALSGYFILLSFFFLKEEKPLLSGVAVGLAFTSEYLTIFFGIVWGIYLLTNKKFSSALRLFLGVLPFIAFLAIYNYYQTGHPLHFAYRFQENFAMNAHNYGFTWPKLQAFWGLTFSPYRGLFFYAPMLVILIFFWVLATMKFSQNKLSNLAALSAITYLILLAANKSWYGGWTFGPRYLYPSAILLFVGLAAQVKINEKWQHSLLFGVGIIGLMHAIANKVTVWYPPTEAKFPLRDSIWPAIKSNQLNSQHIFAGFELSNWVVAAIFSILLVGFAFYLKQRNAGLEQYNFDKPT